MKIINIIVVEVIDIAEVEMVSTAMVKVVNTVERKVKEDTHSLFGIENGRVVASR